MCIATIGAAALPANAQRAAAPTIGVLDSAAANKAKLTAFYEGLKTESFVRDQNFTVQYASAAGEYSRLLGLAVDLVARQVSLIGALGAPAALAATRATTTGAQPRQSRTGRKPQLPRSESDRCDQRGRWPRTEALAATAQDDSNRSQLLSPGLSAEFNC